MRDLGFFSKRVLSLCVFEGDFKFFFVIFLGSCCKIKFFVDIKLKLNIVFKLFIM